MNLQHFSMPKPPWVSLLISDPTSDVDAYATAVAQQMTTHSVVRVLRSDKMRDFDGLFDEFASELRFPSYFGRNFNALEDCLSDLDWLPGAAYLLIIRNAVLLLANEEDADLAALMRLLVRVCEEWAQPVVAGEAWDRGAIPFHVLLHCSSEDTPRLTNRLESLGMSALGLVSFYVPA